MAEDFGLIECPQCGAALFIEFDGTIRRRDEKPEVEPPVNLTLEEAPGEAMTIEPPVGLSSMELSALDPQSLVAAPAPEPGQENAEIEQQPVAPVKVAPPRAATGTGFGLKDLADYGNSQLSSAREGAYSYDISIRGIDSADLRTAIKEALTDPLFLWDSEALIREARQGELKIAKVTAVKAALIVQRLRGLPIDIKWVQNVLFEG